MSRRCCPRVDEGMAWGRGRWGCMAVLGGSDRIGLCSSRGLLSVPAASFTYNLLQKQGDASIHVLLLLDCSVLWNICWLTKGLVHLCSAVVPHCMAPPPTPTETIPIRSNCPWISPPLSQDHQPTKRGAFQNLAIVRPWHVDVSDTFQQRAVFLLSQWTIL